MKKIRFLSASFIMAITFFGFMKLSDGNANVKTTSVCMFDYVGECDPWGHTSCVPTACKEEEVDQ